MRVLLAIVSCLFLTRAVIADHYDIPTGSMRPTVQLGDHIVVHKSAYGLRVPFTHHYLIRWSAPRLGDVVMVDSPLDGRMLLKRVVAVPGQRVEMERGWIKIDGEWVWLKQEGDAIIEALGQSPHPVWLGGGGPKLDEIALGENCYLVVGDNRGDSLDGRTFGCVGSAHIQGRALGVFMSAHKFLWRAL